MAYKTWERHYSEFVQVLKKTEYSIIPVNDLNYRWFLNQRKFYKEGTLSKEREEKLREIHEKFFELTMSELCKEKYYRFYKANKIDGLGLLDVKDDADFLYYLKKRDVKDIYELIRFCLSERRFAKEHDIDLYELLSLCLKGRGIQCPPAFNVRLAYFYATCKLWDDYTCISFMLDCSNDELKDILVGFEPDSVDFFIPKDKRKILYRRAEGLTLLAIAKEVGCSKAYIGQCLSYAEYQLKQNR